MEKRVSARAIIIEDDKVLSMFRRKRKENGSFKEYYVMPGGGVEGDESLNETCLRELKEEYNVDIKLLGYLGSEERDTTIAHFFHAEIVSGIPTLGGIEAEKNNENNYYEIRRVELDKLKEIDIDGITFIEKAKNKEYKEYVKNR